MALSQRSTKPGVEQAIECACLHEGRCAEVCRRGAVRVSALFFIYWLSDFLGNVVFWFWFPCVFICYCWSRRLVYVAARSQTPVFSKRRACCSPRCGERSVWISTVNASMCFARCRVIYIMPPPMLFAQSRQLAQRDGQMSSIFPC